MAEKDIAEKTLEALTYLRILLMYCCFKVEIL